MLDISCFNLLSSQLFTNLLQIPADSLITIDYDLDSDLQDHILCIGISVKIKHIARDRRGNGQY